MKKLVGVVGVLIALAVLPNPAFPESLSGVQLRPKWTLEDRLNLDPIPFEENINDSLKEIILKDSIFPIFWEEYRFLSDFDISLASELSKRKPNMNPQLVGMSSTLSGNDAHSTARAVSTLPGILDIDLIELSSDMMVRLKVSDPSDFPTSIVRSDLTSAPETFSYDAVGDDQTNYAYKLGSEVRWLFTDRLGLFLEYRFLHSDIDIDPTTGTATPNLDSDLNSHSVLGGIGFRF